MSDIRNQLLSSVGETQTSVELSDGTVLHMNAPDATSQIRFVTAHRQELQDENADLEEMMVRYAASEVVKNTVDNEGKRVFQDGDEKQIQHASAGSDLFLLLQTMFMMMGGDTSEE